MPFAYLDVSDNVVATAKVDTPLATIQNKMPAAATKVDNAPGELVAQPVDDFRITAHHRKTSGNGTDISHYTLIDYIEPYKQQRYAEIDARTNELILAGFTFDSQVFSLSIPAQINWTDIMTGIRTGVRTNFDFPLTVSTKDNAAYSLEKPDDALDLYAAAVSMIEFRLQGGRTLKSQIAAAVDVAAVDAIIDSRQESDTPTDLKAGRRRRADGSYTDWRYEVAEESGGKPSKVSYYATDNGDGTYSDLVEDVVYAYTGKNLVSTTTTYYNSSGQVVKTIVENFFTNGNDKIRKIP